MLGQTKAEYKKLKTAMENDIMNRFPAISKHINAINIDKMHLSGDIRSAGIGIAMDSKACAKEALPLGVTPQKAIRMEEPSNGVKRYIDKAMDSLIKSGVSEAEAHKRVKDSLIPMMGFDPATKQYVISARAPEEEAKKLGVMDSLLEQTSIPMWNIGWLTKIFKQPFATSHAKNLVSVESFNKKEYSAFFRNIRPGIEYLSQFLIYDFLGNEEEAEDLINGDTSITKNRDDNSYSISSYPANFRPTGRVFCELFPKAYFCKHRDVTSRNAADEKKRIKRGLDSCSAEMCRYYSINNGTIQELFLDFFN